MMQSEPSEMTAWEVIELLQLLDQNGIQAVVDGGWGVDALHGEAHELRAIEHALAVQLAEASHQQCGYRSQPEEYETNPGGTFVFQPRLVYAWKDIPKDVTRWRID